MTHNAKQGTLERRNTTDRHPALYEPSALRSVPYWPFVALMVLGGILMLYGFLQIGDPEPITQPTYITPVDRALLVTLAPGWTPEPGFVPIGTPPNDRQMWTCERILEPLRCEWKTHEASNERARCNGGVCPK